GELTEKLVGEPGVLLDQAAELAGGQDEDGHVGFGGDRRRAGTVIEQGQFTHRLTGTECSDSAVVAFHDGGALDDEERLASEIALIDEDGSGLPGHLVRGPGDPLEIAFAQSREERDLSQVLEVFAARCHGGSIETKVTLCSASREPAPRTVGSAAAGLGGYGFGGGSDGLGITQGTVEHVVDGGCRPGVV